MQNYFKEYLNLRNEVDKECDRLWEIHKAHMLCKPGCSTCCQSFRILPIEFYSIQNALKSSVNNIPILENEEGCRFLNNNSCIMYENRPIMCRTHGFPLVRLNEEAGAYEVSFCELNFKKLKLRDLNENNVLHEDQIYNQLFEINKRFIHEHFRNKYEPLQLIELNELY